MTFPFAEIDLTAVVVVLMGGGLLTGIVALVKVRPERDAVIVTSAQGALVVQSGVLDAVREELERMRAELLRVIAERDRAFAERDEEKRMRIAAERRVRELEGEHGGGGG